jgi:hypothetical protein
VRAELWVESVTDTPLSQNGFVGVASMAVRDWEPPTV